MMSRHVSQRLHYILCLDPTCFWDLGFVPRKSVFEWVQDSFQALAFCASTGRRY